MFKNSPGLDSWQAKVISYVTQSINGSSVLSLSLLLRL